METLLKEYKKISGMLRNFIKNMAACIETVTYVACEIKKIRKNMGN
jgi:hypothetical protein